MGVVGLPSRVTGLAAISMSEEITFMPGCRGSSNSSQEDFEVGVFWRLILRRTGFSGIAFWLIAPGCLSGVKPLLSECIAAHCHEQSLFHFSSNSRQSVLSISAVLQCLWFAQARIALMYLLYGSNPSPSQFRGLSANGMESLNAGHTRCRTTAPSIGTGGSRSKPNDRHRKCKVFDINTEVHSIWPYNTAQESAIDSVLRIDSAQSRRTSSIVSSLRSPQTASGLRH